MYTIKKAPCIGHFFDCREQICLPYFFITKDPERQKKLAAVQLPAFFHYVSFPKVLRPESYTIQSVSPFPLWTRLKNLFFVIETPF